MAGWLQVTQISAAVTQVRQWWLHFPQIAKVSLGGSGGCLSKYPILQSQLGVELRVPLPAHDVQLAAAILHETHFTEHSPQAGTPSSK